MKNLTTLKTVVAIILCLTISPIINAQKKVKGSGNVTTKTISTADYHTVNTVGSLTVELVSGVEGNIKVIADDNLQEFVEITNNNGTLKVTTKNNTPYYTSKNGIRVIVPFKDLESVNLTGSGDVNSKNEISAQTFTAKLIGSGDMNLTINATTVNAEMKGSGDLKIEGSATTLKAVLTGSGDLMAKKLNTETTDVSLKGSGDAAVYASKNLKARVNGSGDIEYYGNPTNPDTKVSGSGDIDRM